MYCVYHHPAFELEVSSLSESNFFIAFCVCFVPVTAKYHNYDHEMH